MAETLTWTQNGLVTAGEAQVGDVIQGGQIMAKYVSPEPVDVWRLEMEGGIELTMNAEHPLMTPSGFKTCADLEEGDEVKLMLEGEPAWAESLLSDEDAYFLGLMIGNGSFVAHDGEMRFTSCDQQHIDAVVEYVGRFAEPCVRQASGAQEVSWCSIAFKKLLESAWGVKMVKSPKKEMPREVTKNRARLASFLQGYTETDGCVYCPENVKERQIVWVSASKKLLQQTQQALLVFGVYSALSRRDHPYSKGGKVFESWRLRARGPSADVFMDTIGLRLERKRNKYVSLGQKNESHRWLKIREKEHLDEKHFVVGFTVAPDNQYITHGVLSHNSGKSRSIAQEIAWVIRGKHPLQAVAPAARVYCISASYRTLQEGIWRHLKTLLPEWEIEKTYPTIASWDLPAAIRMKGGGQADFISGDGVEEARKKVQAAEIDVAVVDEEVDGSIIQELQARRLARGGRMIVAATLFRSDLWALEFEDRAETGDEHIDLFRFSSYRARDCGHIKDNVLREMEAGLSEEDREVRLEGKSRRFQGLVYPEFSKDQVIEPFEIPKDWTRYCALDPGWRTFAVLWAAVAPDGHYVIYRELYYHGKQYTEIADQIFGAEGWEKRKDEWYPNEKTEEVETRWIDPSAFGHHESGELRTGTLLVNYGLSCAPAQNDVEAGVSLCRAACLAGIDGRARMRVFRTCRNFLEEVRVYRREKDNRDTSKRERNYSPVKRRDHLMDCVSQGHLIRTVDGDIPIERLTAGDLVLTRQGYQPVIAAWETGERKVYTVTLSNGETITGTANHPVWVQAEGWKGLARLMAGDTLLECDAQPRFASKASFSGAIPTAETAPTERTLRHTSAIGSRALVAFTKRFGSRLTGQSPKASAFITGTVIASTTKSRTSRAFQRASICLTTTAGNAPEDKGGISLGYGRSQKHGTHQRLGDDGTPNIQETYGERKSQESGAATSAAKLLCPSRRERSSARFAVKRRRGDAITVLGVKSAGTEVVYNLQVANVPEYFCNGVLVHNCWRYLELGGLEYILPPDRWTGRHADEDLKPPRFRGAPTMEEAFKRDWERILERQSNNHGRTHPSGIGSEY